MPKPTKAVFLDRDGTIIADKGYVHKIADLSFLPGAIEGLRLLQEMGFLLIIATNQSGIARGLFSEEDYASFTAAMIERLASSGIGIAQVYHCPHLGGCDCRKPKLGMYLRAQNDWEVSFSDSYVIGDKIRDLSLCQYFQTVGFLLDDAFEEKEPIYFGTAAPGRVYIAANLLQAAYCIRKQDIRRRP